MSHAAPPLSGILLFLLDLAVLSHRLIDAPILTLDTIIPFLQIVPNRHNSPLFRSYLILPSLLILVVSVSPTYPDTRTRRVTESEETEMPPPTSVTGPGTRTPDRSRTPINIQTPSHPTGHVEVVPGQSIGELYDSDEQDEYPPESSASRNIGHVQRAEHATAASGAPYATDRGFINRLMGSGMARLQGHMAASREGEMRKQRDYYKEKAEKLEQEKKQQIRQGKQPQRHSEPPTPGPSGTGGDPGPGDPRGPGGGGGDDQGGDGGGDPAGPGPGGPNNDQLDEMRRNVQLLGLGGKGPKMKVPETFAGERDDVTRFIRQCKVYLVAKPREFNSEMEKMLWITSLCHGKAVEGWVDWITSMFDEGSVEAPSTVGEMLAYLKVYFGDPDEKSTAQHDLDHLKQTRRVDEYVTAFQSIAYKTKYSAEELEHRFIVGLKHEIRDKCLAAYPRPEGLGEWIARAYALQHAFDLNVKYNRGEGQSNSYRGRVPGRLHPRTQANYSNRQSNNRPRDQQTFDRPQNAPQSQPQINSQ